jgi:hypothetical protein
MHVMEKERYLFSMKRDDGLWKRLSGFKRSHVRQRPGRSNA